MKKMNKRYSFFPNTPESSQSVKLTNDNKERAPKSNNERLNKSCQSGQYFMRSRYWWLSA